jgi:hypothetical protein
MFSVHDVFLEQLRKYSYSVYLYKQKMAVNLKFSGFDYAMHLRYCLQTFTKIMLPMLISMTSKLFLKYTHF